MLVTVIFMAECRYNCCISSRVDRYEDFKVMCDIYYGGRKLAEGMETTNKPSVCGGLFDTIVWDEW